MVLNFSLTGPYSGRPAFNGYLLVEGSQEAANNRTTFRVRLYARNPNGNTQTYDLDAHPWAISIGGRNWSGSHNLDFRGGQSSILLADFWTGWYNHNAAGNLTIGASFSHGGDIFGIASGSNGSIVINRIPKAPGKPPKPVLSSVSTTAINFTIGAPPDNGGAAISTYNLQASLNASFTSIARSWNSKTTAQTASPLDPGTPYWIRYRAVNSVGAGPYSDALQASTLPAVPPGMTVEPSISGTSTTITLTPPSGVSSVTEYVVERRAPGGGPATVFRGASPIVIQPVAPGTSYEYRASAMIGTYQTPWTDWVLRSQPQPNTNPGDYFDGSTPSTDDVTYSWSGAANNSASVAMAMEPLGWFTSDGIGTVSRVTGGRTGPYAARVTFFADTVAPFFCGSGPFTAAEGGVYWGSIYVSPSRSQRMAAAIRWMDSDGFLIGATAVGDPVIVPAAPDEMVRLVTQSTAPPGAVSGAVGWIDVTGDGWSPWLGGETVLADDAMASVGVLYPWFSGDTADTAEWEYSWLGTPNASVSMATALDPEDVDLLADPDCPPVPAPPGAPPIVDDCIDTVGSWRRYWAIIPQDLVSSWLDIVPTLTLATGALPARQVRIRTWRNPDSLDPASYPAAEWESEQIVSYMPADTVLTLDGVAQRVWAEVAGGQPIGADRLLYGTGGGPASWPVISCGTAYLISFDVPLDAPEGNLATQVALTTRML